MKAIDHSDGPLRLVDQPDLQPGLGEVLIRNRATAINRADLVQRSGGYPPPPGASPVLGLECAGEVEAVGADVLRFAPGDRVCALLAGGGYAEQVVVPAPQVLPIPDGLDFVRAAAVPEVFATAWLNLYMEAGARPGERVLLHAGASGVGTAAIQLCREFDNPCWVTAGSREKIDRCMALGAAGGTDRNGGDFAADVKSWSEGHGVDVILDPVGGGYLAANLQSLAVDGRLVLIGLMGGTTAEALLGLMLVKRLRLIGSTLRARSIAAKGRIMAELEANLWPKLADGSIEPVIEASFPLAQAEAAHALIAGNETVGKIILEV